MRKLIISSLLLLCGTGVCFGQLTARVDERIELTGVVFRLAGIPEYAAGDFDEYNREIDSFFFDNRYHELIEYVIKLRNEDRLGYSSVAGSAMFICIENGRVIPNPRLSVERLPGLGTQWKEETFGKYVELLDDFYRKTDFRKFYDAHRQLYEQAEADASEVFKDFNASWFPNFSVWSSSTLPCI